jgi:ATP phosphoribosyltransferase regulatory subunit
VLKEFLSIDVPLINASAAGTGGFADGAGLKLGNARREKFAARAKAIANARRSIGIDPNTDAAFGRPLDYYTGLVFEVAVDNARCRAGRWRPL